MSGSLKVMAGAGGSSGGSSGSSSSPAPPSTAVSSGGYGGATANPPGYTGSNIFSDYTPSASNPTGDSPGGGIDTTGMYKYYDPNAGRGGGGGGSKNKEPEKTPEEIEAEKEAQRKEFEDAAQDELGKHWEEAASTTQSFVDKAELDPANINRVDHVDTAELRDMLQQIVDNQKQQSDLRIDRTVDQGVNELQRALEDAADQFQTQRNQVSADEANALDNQALYAESRGDRGGIGQSQYNSIQNTAATNRLRVNQAQTKLSTDTSRQIADLRAQGEFQKADALLSITQSYLSELKSLEQWALQTNLSVDEFNVAVDEWEAEFNRNAQQFLINTELSTAQVTGAFANGTPTLAAREQLREQLAMSGQAMMEMGLTPTPAQIEAMGFNADQWGEYQEKNKKRGRGGGGVNYYGQHLWDTAIGQYDPVNHKYKVANPISGIDFYYNGVRPDTGATNGGGTSSSGGGDISDNAATADALAGIKL